MDYSNNFSYDLRIGQLGERTLANILNDSTIEVKTDLKAFSTGNVFVEYRYKNKPSGISTSQAHFWCFILSDTRMCIILTEDLKDKCRKYLNTNRDIDAGDHNLSKGILLPITELVYY